MIRFGLLGASRIAPHVIMWPARNVGGAGAHAIASRDINRANAYASTHAIPNVVASYAELIARDDIDVVYNGLPPSEHEEWTLRALANGKHVLCEKPFAMNADEATRMVDAAKRHDRILIEAFHYRFHPLFRRVLDIVMSGALGRLTLIESQADIGMTYRSDSIRHDPKLGGGSLMDLGCYAVHWARTIAHAAGHAGPEKITANAKQNPPGLDVAIDSQFTFSDGLQAHIGCAFEHNRPDRYYLMLIISGEKGTLVVENPMLPHSGHRLLITLGDTTTEETFGTVTTYDYQLKHVLNVLAGTEQQVTGGNDAIENMRAIDRIYQAAGMAIRSR